jgi:hypothetical protein
MKSRWIKADFSFAEPVVRLTMDQRDLVGQVMNAAEDDPEKLEPFILGAIATYRPDLSGGILHAIAFDFTRFRWEIVYSHPSLQQRVGVAEMIPEMPLVPEDGPVAVVEG